MDIRGVVWLPRTQLEGPGQTPDDRDGVGGVGAELMKRWEEGVPLVLQLRDTQGRTHTEVSSFPIQACMDQGWTSPVTESSKY